MAVEKAEADLRRARIDVNKLEVQLAQAQQRVTKLEHYIEMAKLYESTEDDPGVPGTSRRRSQVVSLVMDILRRNGSPMQTRDLVIELEKRGHPVGGSNPVTNLSSTLSRADELVNRPPLGWAIDDPGPAPNPGGCNSSSEPEPWESVATPTPTPAPATPSEPTPAPKSGYSGFAPSGPDLDDEIPF